MEKSCNYHKEPWLAVVLSSFLAGIGQIYAGRKWRGSILILTVAAMTCLLIWSELSPKCDILVSAGLLVILDVFWIWNLFDAHKCARKANSDNFEAERKQGKDPWLALFLSDLIPGLGQIYIKKWLWGIFFIVVGGLLLAIEIKYPFLHVGPGAVLSGFVCYHAYISAPVHRELSKRMILIVAILITCLYLLNYFNGYVFKAYIVEAFRIPTVSMKPTIIPGDRFLVRKNKKYIPKRGDVVAFKPPDDPDTIWIKRVAALPGETLEIKNDILYIDGQEVQQSALKNFEYPPGNYLGMEGEPYRVPEDHLFVIGDNTANSQDSRFFGAVPQSDVIGRAYKIYWPLGRRGPIK